MKLQGDSRNWVLLSPGIEELYPIVWFQTSSSLKRCVHGLGAHPVACTERQHPYHVLGTCHDPAPMNLATVMLHCLLPRKTRNSSQGSEENPKGRKVGRAHPGMVLP